MVEITGIIKNSPVYKKAKIGDKLIAINGNDINDVLDYMFYAAERKIELKILSFNIIKTINLVKGEYDDIGLEFNSFLMDDKRSCRNKCVFCFIDQMPPGMRETLYFKDDDARLSFLHGNYVTLTNLDQNDIDRIIKMKININISVHTTNPELRCRMMNNRFAGEKLKYLKQMTESGIKLNCQIVLCPKLNDGEELERTLSDLELLMPNIQSIAVVPVGLSKYRDGLYPLKPFDKNSAEAALKIINKYQQIFLKKYETRLVFPADEFFLTAHLQLPEADYYEDYSQYENGVGMLRSLEDEFNEALKIIDCENINREVSIATGAAAFNFISVLARKAESKIKGLKCNVYKIINNFFGETITVTGLITGQDLINQLLDKNLGNELLISNAMIRQDSNVFLDDITVEDVIAKLNINVRITSNDGFELLDGIVGIEQ